MNILPHGYILPLSIYLPPTTRNLLRRWEQFFRFPQTWIPIPLIHPIREITSNQILLSNLPNLTLPDSLWNHHFLCLSTIWESALTPSLLWRFMGFWMEIIRCFIIGFHLVDHFFAYDLIILGYVDWVFTVPFLGVVLGLDGLVMLSLKIL